MTSLMLHSLLTSQVSTAQSLTCEKQEHFPAKEIENIASDQNLYSWFHHHLEKNYNV